MSDSGVSIRDLQREVDRLERVNAVLMRRIERTVDLQGNDYSIFQAASELETRIRERTAELEIAMERLEIVNADLTRTMRSAEAANRAKSEFLANMSHEIRTPMNGVLGMAEILLSSEMSGHQRRSVETLQRSAESLLGIIDDILDFSKIEAGQLEVEQVPFNPALVIEDSLRMLAERAFRKGLELLVDLDPKLPTSMLGDPTRIRQVITNLCGNAIKFTEEGHITVRAFVDAELLQVEVCDTGIGIPEEAQSRIFKAFSQADGSTTRRFGGTGLGLCIAKQLVEYSGGHLAVESEPDVGSRFFFTIPIEQATYDEPDRIPGATLDHRLQVISDSDILALQLMSIGESLGLRAARLRAEDPIPNPENVILVLDAMLDGEVASGVLDQFLTGASPRAERPAIVLTSARSSAEQLFRDGLRLETVDKPCSIRHFRQALLRLFQSTARTAESPRPKPAAADLGLRVLLAEDNPVNQRVARGMLKMLGCPFTVVDDGQQALRALAAESFDVVLMDCHMPVCDGFEATRRIREVEDPKGLHTPVVALTASAMPEDRLRCESVGMDDYLTKPYRLADLRALLERWGQPGTASS